VGKGKQKLSFTLLELVTVIALVSLLLVFLSKLNFSSQNSNLAVKSAVKILASSLDSVRAQAISNNNFACLAIDIASAYKFRRIAIYRRGSDDSWIAEHILILPERTFIIPIDELSNYLDGQDLSPYRYEEENFPMNGEAINCYSFVFSGEGILCNVERNSTIIAIGYGINHGENVQMDKDSILAGVFMVPTGQQVILESKTAIKEVL
jgi:hypothetical protein